MLSYQSNKKYGPFSLRFYVQLKSLPLFFAHFWHKYEIFQSCGMTRLCKLCVLKKTCPKISSQLI